MPRMINVPSVVQTGPDGGGGGGGGGYSNKSLLNVDGNYYSRSKRKRPLTVSNLSIRLPSV